jgi:DNA-binding NarL/FixJ family response regulator
MKKKIIIIDNHEVYSNKFCKLLENNNFSVSYIFQSPNQAIEYLNNNFTEIVFCDILMPESNGPELVKKIKKVNFWCKVVFLSMYTEKNIISKTLLKKIDGYIPSTYGEIEIKDVISDSFFKNKKNMPQGDQKELIKNEILQKYRITKREKEIIHYVLNQKSSVEIAKELLISKRTVETHRRNIMDKFKVKNTIGIAVKLLEQSS